MIPRLPSVINDRHHRDCHSVDKTICSKLPPPPRPRPQDKHIAAHADVLYDSETNWLSSNLLLSLGTICISYKNDVSSDTQKFGLKVAIRDKYGNPQVWRDLPFLEPDLTPSISTLISELSSTFVMNNQFSAEISGIHDQIAEIQSSLPQLSVSIQNNIMTELTDSFWCLDCGTGTTVIVPDENLRKMIKGETTIFNG